MTLIASDGYEYEDLTQRLLGKPKSNWRNIGLREVRQSYEAKTARVWVEAYDRAQGGHDKAEAAAWCAAWDALKLRQRDGLSRPNRTRQPAARPAPAAAVHAAH